MKKTERALAYSGLILFVQGVLSDTIREWQGKNEQTDDRIILGIRI